jgi:hypothetical protein
VLLFLTGWAFPASAMGDLTQVTSVDGRIVDASATRVLYRTPDDQLVIRDVSDPLHPSDAEIPLPPGRSLATEDTARLIPGGALYATVPTGANTPTQIHEWRNGVRTDLGALNSEASIVVAGNYAIWSNATVLTRRDVVADTNVTIATDAGNIDNDVAANGDVVYWDSTDFEVHRWHSGVATTLSSSGADQSTYPRTDGTTTVFRRHPPLCCGGMGGSILFSDGTTETPLAGSLNASLTPQPDSDYRIDSGWIAYTRAERTQLSTRSPGGATADLTPPASTSMVAITGVSPAGQVMYESLDTDAARLLLRAGSAPAFPLESQPYDSSRFPWRAFWSGGHWYVIHPHSLIRVDVDTAVTARPPAATSSRSADFELASTSPDPSFACELDGNAEPCSSSLHLTNLADGPHTLTVRSTDQGSLEQDSTPATATWTVDTSSPEPFALAGPADGAALADPTPTLTWDAASDSGSGIASYELQIDGQPAGTIAPDQTTFTPATALSEGSHSWQVTATNGAGLGRDSATRAFTVDTVAPSAPALNGPTDGAATATARPSFTWSQATDPGSGVVGYDVEIDGVATRVSSGAQSFTPSADLGEGAHSWRVVALDAAGNRSASPGRQVTVDTRSPTARVTATPDPALTGDSVGLDASASSPGGAAIDSYEWDLDGDGSYETSTGASPVASRTYDTPGDRHIGVRATDAAGRVGTGEVLLHVTPAPLPGLPGISINDGDQYTNDPAVTITARWPHFAVSMLASNDGGFDGAEPAPVAAHFDWQLASSGSERLPKTVYVRFSGGLAGNETYTDDIILDETAPRVLTATLRPARGNRGAAAKRRFVAHVRGRDGASGLARLQVTAYRSHPGASHRYARTLVVSVSRRPRWARLIDRAGNRSPWHRLKLLHP